MKLPPMLQIYPKRSARPLKKILQNKSLFQFVLFRYSLPVYFGYWRVYLVLEVPNMMALLCFVYCAYRTSTSPWSPPSILPSPLLVRVEMQSMQLVAGMSFSFGLCINKMPTRLLHCVNHSFEKARIRNHRRNHF